MLSLAEENYLKTIYHLSSGGAKSVLTNELADAMNNKAASATDMIKKLAGKEFITYEKYYGVNVTSKGKTAALQVIRKHRLWETFLVQKLGFHWHEVHEVAEQLEHIHSSLLIDKLDEFLGFPKIDPHGDVIPDNKGRIKVQPQVALDQLKSGYNGVIQAVRDSDSHLLKYLDKIGAHPGIKIKVLAKEDYDDSMEVMIHDKRVFVSKEVSKKHISGSLMNEESIIPTHKQGASSGKSLSDVHASVDITGRRGWNKLLAFFGPAYLVSVGYMDPGNWATDIAGGSRFGYALIWVLLMSNLMALLLQSLSARLGVVRQLDLAQASRRTYHPVINFILWILAEIAIAACDLAEVLGMAIGLQLLFGLPLIWGVSLTVLDTLLLLMLQTYGIRKIEAFIITLVAIIGGAFLIEMILAKPAMGELVKGFVPSIPGNEALYIAIGIIGATVMPHNLYLHSSLVQTRRIDSSEKGIWQAIKYNLIDSAIALNAAFFVNMAILVLAASTFFKAGLFEVVQIQDAHRLLAPLLGTGLAPILFGVALVAAGQSSTITGTLAGQIVMEGFLNLRIAPWLRRLITRVIAIIPAYFVIILYGESETGPLLVFSQVVLSLQLGFAIIPLIHFNSDKKTMGVYVIKPWMQIAAWTIAFVIVSLNVKLVFNEVVLWLEKAGEYAWILWLTVIPLCLAAGLLLLYIVFKPLIERRAKERAAKIPHGTATALETITNPIYHRIAVTIDFSTIDTVAIQSALAQGGKEATYLLVHIVETAGAMVYGADIADRESSEDEVALESYVKQLRLKGFKAEMKIGYGGPKRRIPEIVKEFNADLLVMGAHGHKFLKDLIFGTTVDTVRHRVSIPVFIVREK